MRRIILALCICSSLAAASIAQEAVISAPTVVESRAPTVFHSGWAALDAEGNIQGQVVTVGDNGQSSPQAGAVVEIANHGGPVASSIADDSGHFVLQGIKPGIYRLSAAGQDSFAAHGVQVLSHKPGVDGGISVYASSLSQQKVDEILRGLFVPPPAASPSYRPFEEPAMPIAQSQRVASSNGVVTGRLVFTHGYGDPEAHTVKVLRGGDTVDTVAVDAMGYFSFRATPGAYDVVVGGIGHGALGVEVVGDASQLTQSGSQGKFVAANANLLVQETFMVPVAMPPAGGPPAGDQIIDEQLVGPPIIGGGMPVQGGFAGGGGGFSGGGGGGGLGGGLGGAGGLLGVAGLAVGVAALADDDDGFVVNPATPVAP